MLIVAHKHGLDSQELDLAIKHRRPPLVNPFRRYDEGTLRGDVAVEIPKVTPRWDATGKCKQTTRNSVSNTGHTAHSGEG